MPRLRIAVFAHNLRVGGGRSVGMNLTRCLAQDRPDIDFLMFVPPDYNLTRYGKSVGIIPVSLMGPVERARWELRDAAVAANEFGADWTLALGNIPIIGKGMRSAVLIHDPHLFMSRHLIPGLDWRTRLKKITLRRYLSWALPRVDRVFAQTPSAGAQIASNYGLKTYELAPNAVSRAIDAFPEQSPHLPNGDFRFLTLTRYYPHKNLEVLVDVMRLLVESARGIVGILTIDETDHPRARLLLERIKEAGLDSHLVNVGPIREHQLSSLYSQVDALVLPTLAESFSASYLESMKFGVPILTSDRGFARDLCGDAAIYFNPLDPKSIAAALSLVSNDEVLRRELITSGQRRFHELHNSWTDVAAHIVAALERESARPPSSTPT